MTDETKLVNIYRGEICGQCFRQNNLRKEAQHKIAEVHPPAEEDGKLIGVLAHELTQYVCCWHFDQIMGRHSEICGENMV